MARMPGAGASVAAGQAALARCAWDEARTAFDRAVCAGADPTALEGLGAAAFFLDDGEAAIAARERAYAGYREAARPADAARVAIALAWDYRTFRGEPAVGDGWLARARRLLADLDPGREHGWLALREASFSLPGDTASARERCALAEALGRRLGDLDLEMTAVGLDGLALVSQGEIAAGMRRLDEATAAVAAGEMHDPIAVGFSCCYLIFACERVRDFDRAGQWCERLARISTGWRIGALLAVCRSHYGTVLMLRGEWDRAEVELEGALAGLPPRSGERAAALVGMAELRRRQGRAEQARALLDTAGHHPSAALCLGAVALDAGDADTAAERAAHYLRRMEGARTERAPGLELAAQAHGAAGRADDAADAAGGLREIAQLARTDPLLGAARHAEGCAHRAAGALDRAREAFEDAVALLSRAALPFETAVARIALGEVLCAKGRADAATDELTRARGACAALGAGALERRAAKLLAAPAPLGREALSPREREVLAFVAAGRTNAEIAAVLVISEHTVHRHVANILTKLGASSRAEAVARAAQRGLL
jgi:DNA-binding CsgD family transcriptional regulator